jgi:hypothetical protein
VKALNKTYNSLSFVYLFAIKKYIICIST